MTHCHLSLESARGLKNYADDDEQRAASERQRAERAAGDHIDYQRKHGDNVEEEGLIRVMRLEPS